MPDEFDNDDPEIDEAVWRPLAAAVAERVEGGEACVVVGVEEWDRLTVAGNPGGSPVPMTRATADEAAAFLARTLGGYHEVEAFSEVEPDGAGGWRRKEGGAPGPVFVLSGRDKEAVDEWKRARDAEGLRAPRPWGHLPHVDETAGRLPGQTPAFHPPHLLVIHDAPDGLCWELFVWHRYDLLGVACWGAWAKNPPRLTHCRGPMGFDDRWRARFVACVHDGLLRAPPRVLDLAASARYGVLEYRGALPEGPIGRRPPPDFGPALARAEREITETQGDRERRLINIDMLTWETGRPDPLSGGASLLTTEDRSAFLDAAAEWVGYRGPSSWFDDLDVPGCGEADPEALARAFPLVRADLARDRAFGEPFFSPALADSLAGLVGGDRDAARSLALRAAALDRRMAEQGRGGHPPSPRALAAACRAPLEPNPPLRFHAAGYRARFLAAAA